jgi:hypothetical protein
MAESPRPTADDISAMRRHIAELVEHHNIDCRTSRRPEFVFEIEAWANAWHWRIEIPPVDNEVAYSTALHEIGHLLGRYQEAHRRTLTRERWAWKWAQGHALVWTQMMEWNKRHSLKLYEDTGWEHGMTPEQWQEIVRRRRSRRSPAEQEQLQQKLAKLRALFPPGPAKIETLLEPTNPNTDPVPEGHN